MTRTTAITLNNGTIAAGGAIAGFNCGTNDGTGGLDRSLGTAPTATSSPNGPNRFIEVQIQNESGQTLQAIEVIYTGKQWRTSSSTSGQEFTNYLQFSTMRELRVRVRSSISRRHRCPAKHRSMAIVPPLLCRAGRSVHAATHSRRKQTLPALAGCE